MVSGHIDTLLRHFQLTALEFAAIQFQCILDGLFVLSSERKVPLKKGEKNEMEISSKAGTVKRRFASMECEGVSLQSSVNSSPCRSIQAATAIEKPCTNQ
jgi:hypothetical protein